MQHVDNYNNLYSIINTGDVTTDGECIYKYSIWDALGQQINAGEILATNAREALERLIY
jgi:hypothetical protein